MTTCLLERGTLWRCWLRHCATSRKFAGSIPDEVLEIFRYLHPSGSTVVLELTQALTEMSTRNICWAGRCVGLTQLYHLFEIWEPEPPGTLRTYRGSEMESPYMAIKQLFFFVSLKCDI